MQRHRRRNAGVRLAILIVLVGLVHLIIGAQSRPDWLFHDAKRPERTRLVMVELPERQEEEEEEEQPEEEVQEPELDGQLVEIPEPENQDRPDEADYVAEFNSTVEKETKSEQYEVNPDVLAPEFSEEHKYELEAEDVLDLNVEEPSSGATVGDKPFDPARDGALASVPSPWAVTNKQGTEAPAPASHAQNNVSGAPQNDLLMEDSGDRVALNAREYLYASYLNRIRRLVNFYWTQNIDNLPSNIRLTRSNYTTAVEVTLDSEGNLVSVEVNKKAGVELLDLAVVDAFRLAQPFPNPPEGMINEDQQVPLPDMAFTLNVTGGRMNFYGVDPRANVEFPGLLRNPR